jgi:hypothetical protein
MESLFKLHQVAENCWHTLHYGKFKSTARAKLKPSVNSGLFFFLNTNGNLSHILFCTFKKKKDKISWNSFSITTWKVSFSSFFFFFFSAGDAGDFTF